MMRLVFGDLQCRTLPLLACLVCTACVDGVEGSTESQALEERLRRGQGGLSGFPTYEEANSLLETWEAENPLLFRKQRIGDSYEKRKIYAYVVTAPVAVKHPKPQALVTALIHPREPATLCVALYVLGRLLELYKNKDPEAMYILDHREVWVIPFINPDGYVENQRRTSNRARMVRKNMRPTCDRRKTDSGVDLNANFGFHWRRNEFPPCDEAYSGSAPFSEPESQAVKKACDNNNFKIALNFHAYGGMLIYPYNWATRRKDAELPAADRDIYKEIALEFGWPKSGSVRPLLGYSANGEADDWMYGEKGIIAMAPEIGPETGGFWPNPSTIPGITTRNFARTLHALHKAGLQPDIAMLRTAARPSLRIANNGVAASSDLILALQIESAGLSYAEGFDIGGVDKTSESVKGLPRDTGQVVLQLKLQPLARRTHRDFPLPVTSDGPVSVRACFLERVAGGVTVCQCMGPVSAGDTTVASRKKTLRFVDVADALCLVAAGEVDTDASVDHPGGSGGMRDPDAHSATPVTAQPQQAQKREQTLGGDANAMFVFALLFACCTAVVTCFLIRRCRLKQSWAEPQRLPDEGESVESGYAIGRPRGPLE
eukprot:TRINITY_DN90803_c0_g1_i1.p1 TRINITY_DN90803_c0_g1~~TRINITY_DN90803_c0_g1_i1.p1  ORF type:complete len:601 (+),score=55.80 TRINITY_DN90803_c0_g1_i1:106-1908(+)